MDYLFIDINLVVSTDVFTCGISLQTNPHQAGIGDDPFNFQPPQQKDVWDARTELPYNPFISCCQNLF